MGWKIKTLALTQVVMNRGVVEGRKKLGGDGRVRGGGAAS